MKTFTKAIIIPLIFLLASCAEEIKEKSELEKCIDANIGLIQNGNIEVLAKYPGLLQLPIKATVDFYESLLLDNAYEEQQEELVQNLNDLRNKDTAKTSFRYLQDAGYLSENVSINLDADEVYMSLFIDGIEMKLQDAVIEFELQDPIKETSLSSEEAELFKIILLSTIKLTNKKTLKVIAQNTCYWQGIY